jgi:hypothetical protein
VAEALGLLTILAIACCALLARFFARGWARSDMRALSVYFATVGAIFLVLFVLEQLSDWPITAAYARWRSLIFRVGHGLALVYLVFVLRPNGRAR